MKMKAIHPFPILLQTNELAPTTPETTETADLEPEHKEVFDPQSIV